MIRCFVEPTVYKWIVKGVTHLSCCIIVVLGILLVPNSTWAFQKDDEVVAQNKGPGIPVIVRLDHWVSNPWDANVKDSVPNGTRGTILDGPERGNDLAGNELVWYKIRWSPDLEGWSAETVTIDGCKVIGPAAVADQRDAIVNVLFKGLPHFKCTRLAKKETDYVYERTNHDYNSYKCFPSKISGYQGGHSGWDVQTCSAAGLNFAHEPFYSLTAGIIIAASENDKYNTIAIFDGEKTILYLHAREIDEVIKQSVDEYIDQGTYLGIQGNEGLWPENLEALPDKEREVAELYKNNTENYREHVHIEVRKGKIPRPALGAGASQNGKHPTIDPIPHLYRWVNGDLRAGFLPWDVNHDGDVDIWDWLRVLGSSLLNLRQQYDSRCDVNSDGIVDKADRDEVSRHFGESPPRSPTISTRNPVNRITKRGGQFFIGSMAVSPEMVQQLLDIARKENNGSMAFEHGIAMLENLLKTMMPERTVLFANYPNPFNPETWIPYHLAKDTEVTVEIYDTTGALVRLLEIGYQKAGHYTSRDRAIYWDGRTETGERIASGVYFYTLTAGDYTATRKMVILK